jgi:protein-L-isoaspartate(D-aspartate) O-methyltransferase
MGGIFLPVKSKIRSLGRLAGKSIKNSRGSFMMADSIQQARFNMVQQQVRPWDVLDSRVLELIEEMPRERFVPEGYEHLAYADIEIPIGQGQRMMFPRMEGRILQILDLQPTEKVLEIGTGSGYLTACLARMVDRVVSVDIHEEFTSQTQEKLDEFAIHNVTLVSADAMQSPFEEGPFDAIAVTGSVPSRQQVEIFQRQLKVGGRLFVIVGGSPAMQALLITRADEKHFRDEVLFETEQTPLDNSTRPPRFEF